MTGDRPHVRVWVADLALLGITLIWGVTFLVVKDALSDASALLFNALRLTLAAILLAAVYRPRWRLLPARVWRAGAILGLCLASGYALQTEGLRFTDPSTSAFLTGLSVVLVPLLLATLWRRRLLPGAWISAGLALLGLYWLVGVGRAGTEQLRGELLTVGCALAFALHIVNLGEWAPRFGFRDLAVLQIGGAAVFTWLMIPALEIPRFHASAAVWIALGVTAVLATAVAFTVQSWAQQFTPASHTAVVFAFEPVFAWLASLAAGVGRLHGVQLAGAGLILAAMVLAESHF